MRDLILLFQPPYCPEANPIERFWEYLKFIGVGGDSSAFQAPSHTES
ncbi:MAG: hypothetical protein MUD14_05580 [Hydrococcus sp. Prado102]|jgi:hypothetical protein|nr:hypothetical protein [Hydrococcus sp. Prado102]